LPNISGPVAGAKQSSGESSQAVWCACFNSNTSIIQPIRLKLFNQIVLKSMCFI
jgi:hypothetical protein